MAGASPQTSAAPALSAADYDKTPTTPADWAGTRADYIQDLCVMVDVTHYSLLSSAIRQQMILKATHTQHITQM
jgi:hypothetical protein